MSYSELSIKKKFKKMHKILPSPSYVVIAFPEGLRT